MVKTPLVRCSANRLRRSNPATRHCEGVKRPKQSRTTQQHVIARAKPEAIHKTQRVQSAKSSVAVSKVKNFLTTRCTKVTQMAQYVDNQNCHFAFPAISLRTLRLKILLIQPPKQSSNLYKKQKKIAISKKSCIFAFENCELIIFNF
jgi:hypothetical protein